MLVIVANEFDPHADAVIVELRNSGFEKFVRIDLETAHSNWNVNLSVSDQSLEAKHRRISGHVLRSEEIKSVWWRRSGVFSNRAELDMPSAEAVDNIELYWAIRWYFESLPSAYFPFGHPVQLERGNNKIYQLATAKNVGMITVDTIFTNMTGSIAKFVSTHPGTVIKPLRSSKVKRSDGEIINLIARPLKRAQLDDILANKDAYLSAYLQERVHKKFDVRLTVLPKLEVACAIAHNELPESEVDYRPKTHAYTHTIIKPPLQVITKCRNYLRKIELKIGMFDFGVREDGQWVFLECNTNGQWLWVDFKTEIGFTRLVAKQLIEHHNSV